ncbi:hypothetical protein L210DRAFT_931971 [Boletus edulis BED1]|uniref:Uncharacterized protein n=1 Tax=Boletus edulis BED1 TaxID=1328754 RepID=A0AAD4GI12_BOLED|nr:hypothetical protein L210DRAFT_931971 [Boletus edulis BED1]
MFAHHVEEHGEVDASVGGESRTGCEDIEAKEDAKLAIHYHRINGSENLLKLLSGTPFTDKVHYVRILGFLLLHAPNRGVRSESAHQEVQRSNAGTRRTLFNRHQPGLQESQGWQNVVKESVTNLLRLCTAGQQNMT